MEEKRRRAPLPPSYPVSGTEAGGSHGSVREIKNPAYVEADGSQGKKLSVPLPDYETLFPQKRHGVQGHTRWDHIIAEVNQKHRDTSPELLGPEMSVDSPEEYHPSPRSISLESPTMRRYHTQPLETKPVSTKKVAAPAPPKPITSSQTQPAADTSQSQDIVHHLRPDPFGSPGSPGHINTAISSRENLSEMSRDGGKKALLPPSVTHAFRPTSQMDETPQPTAKPRQRANGKEETQQEKSALFSQSGSSMDKTGGQAGFVEFDPLSSTGRLSKDQWAYQKQNQDVNNSFASNIKKEQKPQDPGMTTDDLDKIFNQDKPTDPFASFNGSGSNRHSEYKKKSDDSKEADFHAFQRRNSQRQKHSLQSRTHPDNKSFKSQQEPASKDKTTTAAANQSLPARNIANKSVALQPQADVKTQSNFFLEDPFGADPFPMPTALASLEPLQVVTEETAGSMSGGKTPLQAWVSPSEAQPVSAQNSNGGGLAFAPRRPHPVKPLTSVESQHATSGQAVKEIKVWDNTPGKIKVADSGQSGPYTQLTQEELITLVVKQQTDLSKKDAKIVELEEYIDNLVLRVIEEKPSILQTIPPAKQV